MPQLTINKACMFCDEEYQLSVREQDYAQWKNGKHVQDAMPYLPVDARELLISGVCGRCFDKMAEEMVSEKTEEGC